MAILRTQKAGDCRQQKIENNKNCGLLVVFQDQLLHVGAARTGVLCSLMWVAFTLPTLLRELVSLADWFEGLKVKK